MQLEAGRRYNYDEKTITHMLLKYRPRFLELDTKWVDALLEAEEDLEDIYGRFNLMYLFWSEKFEDIDFGCRRFRELLQRQRDWVDNSNWTVLMTLCLNNPQLLGHD